jgi:hypothetical protein
MNSPHRTKRLKGINGSQTKLTVFQRSLPFGLSGTAVMILYYSSQGLNQKAIAGQLGCSPANVSKIAKKLRNRGLLIHPKKMQGLTQTAGSGFALPFDVRFRSLKWKLTHPVNMPYDERVVKSGVTFNTWQVKGSTVRQNIGKSQYSLEIECGYTEGNSMKEAARKHDEEALNTYDWLCEHYPELKQASVRLGYEKNRRGEFTIPQMKEFAEEWLKNHGRLDAGIFKIDDSLKNGGEFQIKMDNLLTVDDIEKLEARFDALDSKLDTVGKVLEKIAGILEKGFGFGKDEPKGPIPEYEGRDYL